MPMMLIIMYRVRIMAPVTRRGVTWHSVPLKHVVMATVM